MRINIENPPRRYSVIYADPPWAYKQQGGAKGRGTAKAHYDTMETAEICSLPVKEIATEDALLFMWATFPNIKDALEVMEAWGFEYKTAAFVWVKTNAKSGSLFWGMGSYTRANAEVCLLGIRKKTKAGERVKAHNIHQIIQAPYTRHSEKPPETRERIKALTGSAGGISSYSPVNQRSGGIAGGKKPPTRRYNMILCQKAKFDQKNRVLVPREYIKLAGGEDNCGCYITFDEDTKEIKIIIKGKEIFKNEG